MNNMTYSEQGMALTKCFEGLSLHAYQDQGGVWTIGYGSTIGVEEGMKCTQAEADARLNSDLKRSERDVNSLVLVPLSQNQFDALVDFVFNVGPNNFSASTLLRELNANKNYEAAAAEFLKWNKIRIKGVLTPSDGLTRRRQAERELFLGGSK